MDFNGNGVLIEQDRLHLALDMQPEQFDMDKFRYICILSGCDYLPSLPGIGLGKARKFITRNTDHNIHRALTRVGLVLNMKSLVVTQEYRDAFILADITFKHQLVFCPLQRKQMRLKPPTADITEDQLQYAGKELNEDLALQLALGNCDPSTLKMLHNFNPDKIERKRKRDVETGQTAIHNSIWSSKYQSRIKNYILSSKNSAIIGRKKLELQTDSLKNKFVSSELHNSPTTQCNEFSGYQNLNESTILDMYNCQNAKLIASSEQNSEHSLCTENNLSPELLRRKNPFVKGVSNLVTSPSVLSNGNCRKRGKNLMRIRQTVIDENTVIESKYFSKQDNKKHDVLPLGNNMEDADLKNIKCNIIADMGFDIHNNKVTQKQLGMLSIRNLAENAISTENINDAFLNQNECMSNSCDNVSKKSYYTDKMSEISSMTTIAQCTIDKNYISDNLLISPNSDDLSNNKNISSLQENLPKSSNIESSQISLHKKLENFKNQNSNLVSRVNSITKRIRQNKQLSSVPNQQSLLNMYGFQKRSSLKH